MEIKKVGVIGAGTMGAGIAAHVTNAGIPVVLLDIVPREGDNRNAIAEGAVKKMHKTKPAPFMHKRNAKLITTGNIEDNMDLLSDCDWIVEAVIERLDIKQTLYRQIDEVRKKDAFVSSNTSTIPLKDLVEGMPKNFTEDFLITHFFNPPRYMRLLEITGGVDTRPEALETVGNFCDVQLGKGVVTVKDTPGFIGNRIGIYWIQVGILEAMDMGLTVEEADAIMGKPIGVPKTGVFGLSDLVGLDLMPHLMESMTRTLPKGDVFHTKAEIPALVTKMIEDGYTGRKGKGGFFRLNREGGKKVKEALDLNTGEYRSIQKPKLKSIGAAKKGLRALVESDDKGGQYAKRVLMQILHYSASMVPEIADNVVAIDDAIKLGYGWAKGPFEMIDDLGTDWFADACTEAGMDVPALIKTAKDKTFYRVENGALEYLDTSGNYQAVERADGVLLLSDIKRKSKPLAKNPSASLWDIGDGVVCLEYTSKMNAFDPMMMEMMHTAIAMVSKDYKALVLHNQAPNYSVGANLGLIMYGANMASWDQLEELIKGGQDTFMALKYAPFPVVGAPSGMCLGGGCESLLHCNAVVAHSETYMGLVEAGVGLLPGWGGCKEMLMRHSHNKRRPGGPMPPIASVFQLISTAQVSASAADAKEKQFLRHDDGISMNLDRLLFDAKARALSMADGYQAPEQDAPLRLPGPTAKGALKLALDGFMNQGLASEHDGLIAMAMADVLSGGDTDVTEEISEQDLLDMERKGFFELLKTPKTLARIEHMLATGKPLRN